MHIYVKNYSGSQFCRPCLNLWFISVSQITVISFSLLGDKDALFSLIYFKKLLLLGIFFSKIQDEEDAH